MELLPKSIFVLLAGIVFTACGQEKKEETTTSETNQEEVTQTETSSSTTETSTYSEDAEGLTQLAKDLDKAQDMTIVKSLESSLEDCKAIFNNEADAAKAHEMIKAKYEQLSSMPSNPIRSKEGQTEVLAINGKVGGDLSEISGGYGNIQVKLNEGTTIYEIKYVKPGETMGMKFSAFIYVNGGWKFFGKLYRAF